MNPFPSGGGGRRSFLIEHTIQSSLLTFAYDNNHPFPSLWGVEYLDPIEHTILFTFHKETDDNGYAPPYSLQGVLVEGIVVQIRPSGTVIVCFDEERGGLPFSDVSTCGLCCGVTLMPARPLPYLYSV